MSMKEIDSAGESPRLPRPDAPAKPVSFFRFVNTLRDNAIAVYPEQTYDAWIVETRLYRIRNFIVNDPEAIKRVLIDQAANYVKGNIEPHIAHSASGRYGVMEEERWRSRRRIVSPAFDYRSVTGYASIMTNSAERLLAQWAGLPAGSVVDLSAAMVQVTVDSIARVIFSSDSEEVARIMERTTRRQRAEVMIHPLNFVPLLDRLWARYKGRMERLKFREVSRAIDRLIAWRAGEPAKDDLLARLISAQGEESGRAISLEEAHGHAFTILTVGHETVAWALAWTWYLLSQHPEQERKFHTELERVLGGRVPTAEDLANLPHTRMVIEESMRLYPPFHTMAWREALADDELCGTNIPKGTIVSIVPWVLHRHRKLWDRPEEFDPERFSPERSAGRSRFAYLPFGSGPRVCIGAVFAMTQAMLVLATVAQRYRLRVAPGHSVEPQARVMLRARSGLKMTLEPR